MIPRFARNHGRWLALAAGLPMFLAFAPFGHWWLAGVLLAVLYVCWQDQPPRERLLRGFWFGVAMFSCGTWWLYVSVHDFGGAPAPFAVLVTLLLVVVMAAWVALAGLVTAYARPLSPAWQMLAVLPATWVLIEWLRGWFLGGFPWLSLGYVHDGSPLSAWAPLAGVHGLGLVTAWSGGALAALVLCRRGPRLAALAGLLAITGLTALLQRIQWVAPAGAEIRVALVQGGVGQDRKWLAEELESTMALYRDLTLQIEDADLIVWPEAAIPALAHEVEAYLSAFGDFMAARDRLLVLGMLRYDFDSGEFHNTLMTVGSRQDVYYKRHLVPFGEFFPVPGMIRRFLRLLNLPYQDIARGPDRQPPLYIGEVALAPSICYEDVFGAEMRRFLPAAGVLLNVSNDGWFGDTIAPHQHLQMARFRALENGRYMVRGTNTGISAVIAPDGAVVARGAQLMPDIVTATVRPYAGTTPWVRFGNVPVIGVAVLMLLLALAGQRRTPVL